MEASEDDLDPLWQNLDWAMGQLLFMVVISVLIRSRNADMSQGLGRNRGHSPDSKSHRGSPSRSYSLDH